MTIKRRLIATVAAVALLFAVEHQADAQGIPVFDDVNLGEWVQSLLDDAKSYALQLEGYVTEVQTYIGDELSWVKQAAQYATQLQQYASELQLFLNFVHNPSLGAALGLLGSIGLTNSLPINPYALMSLMNGLTSPAGGFGQISGLLSALSGLATSSYSANHVYTPTDGSWASGALIGNANSLSGEQGAAAAAYGDLRNHMTVLPALRDHLLAATDTKDVLDASAEVQEEIAWNVNQMAQLQASAITAQAQGQWVTQRDNERLACDIEVFLGRGGGCPNTAAGGAAAVLAGPITTPNTLIDVPPAPPGDDAVIDVPPPAPTDVIDTPPAPPVDPGAPLPANLPLPPTPTPAPPAGPTNPAFADPNNPANNDAALAGVDGGNGQEQNASGPGQTLPQFPTDDNQ